MHGRIAGGDRASALDLLYEAWRQDTEAGKRSLMVVATPIEQAKAIADGKNVAVASAGIARQCLELG